MSELLAVSLLSRSL